MTTVLAGIDVGTTFCKAGLVSEDGREVAHGRVATPWREVPTGAEVDPADVLDAVRHAMDTALSQVPRARVRGVGVTGMAETGVLLDGHGRVVAPSVAWFDTRAEGEAEELATAMGREAFVARTGLAPARLLSACTYRWLRRHHPEAAAGRRWLSVAEWVVRALGGEEVAELSLASRTGFLDLRAAAWWDDVLSWAEAPPGLLPEPHPAGAPAGRVSLDALPDAAGAVLSVGGHDHPCAAVGAGATDQGDVFDSCGTAEALVRSVDPQLSTRDVVRSVAGGVTVGWHTIPGRFALLAGFKSGMALERVLSVLDVAHGHLDRLDREAFGPDDPPKGQTGLRVEGITSDAATIAGIGWDTSPADVWRAALEALAGHGRTVLDLIEGVAGPTRRLVVTGGWARTAGVRATKRAILGPFEEPSLVEAGVRGAALFAGIAAGLYSGVDDLPRVT
jgi:sugar (pentulose or hexulose) kinase